MFSQPWPPCIAFLGPDGAGKSTILERLEKNLSLPNVVGLKILHRGDDTPPAAKKTAPHAIDHHARPPYNALLSTGKVVLRAGQWWQQYHGLIARYRAAGYVVCLDRYTLLDMAIDPWRYRYGGPLNWPRTLAQWLPQPEILLVLDAPEAVLLARKQEVPLAALTRQCAAYRALPTQFRQAHLVNTAQPPENTLAAIHQILHEYHRLARGGHAGRR